MGRGAASGRSGRVAARPSDLRPGRVPPGSRPSHQFNYRAADTYSGPRPEGRGRPDKGVCIYPIISFIWSRFENNSPSHLSLSDHIIHK